MSNEVLNVHIELDEPCGKDADIFDIADWAGHYIKELKAALAAMTAENKRLRDALDQITAINPCCGPVETDEDSCDFMIRFAREALGGDK
jgi:hypothetical protein